MKKYFLLLAFSAVVFAQQRYTKEFATAAVMVQAVPDNVNRTIILEDGGGTFFYSSGSATATNTTTVFKPANYGGRYLAISPVAGVSFAELGYVDGLTSSAQTQLDAKASQANLTTVSNTVNGKALQADLGHLFDLDYGFTQTASVGSIQDAVWVGNSSTFTGWGALCGPQQNFSAVQFYVFPWSTAITQVRAVVRQTDVNGAILGDATVSVTTSVGSPKLVTVNFGANIANAGAAALYFEYHCNAKSGLYQLVSIPYSGTVNYWTGTDPASPGSASTTSAQNFAVIFGSVSGVLESFTPSATVRINLPAKIYASEGIEKNLYFRNFIWANVPQSSIDVDMVTAKGSQYGRFWRVTPIVSDAGSHGLRVRAYKGGFISSEKTLSLVIKAKTVGGGATRKVLWIGDSLTSNGKAIAEMKRIDADGSLDSGLTLTFVGTKTGTASDSIGGSQSYAHEAITGYSFSAFNLTGSPFFLSGAFNFALYLSTNSITLTSGDWILINLGVNDLFNFQNDSDLETGIAAMKVILDAWIVQMKAAVSGVRIGILLPIVSGNADSFAASYGSGQTQWRYERNRQAWVESALTTYDARDVSESIYVFDYNAILDGENNFPTTPIAVNALKSSTVFEAANNGVHPADAGYWQMGQGMFSTLKAQEN